jgi:hypothetical protein
MNGCLTEYIAFMLGFIVAIYGDRWYQMAVSLFKQVHRDKDVSNRS